MQYQVDIHGFTTIEVKKYLDDYIQRLPIHVKEVVVIHGYHGGTSLQVYIRKQYHHKRLKRVLVTTNPGESILVLK
ncbi:MAG: hypothetical protein K2L08_02200 [Erysipelotrichaceae bacterium]|nr:hypothetical protein [Erysipelotrichaceae bacterium]